jgi:hypothetical protein
LITKRATAAAERSGLFARLAAFLAGRRAGFGAGFAAFGAGFATLGAGFAAFGAGFAAFGAGFAAFGAGFAAFAAGLATAFAAAFDAPDGTDFFFDDLGFARAAAAALSAVLAASSFLRASLAAFLACFEVLRACLSCVFASRSWCLAASARVPALSASATSRCTSAVLLALVEEFACAAMLITSIRKNCGLSA